MADSQLFVIRIWQWPARFRASVRRVDRESASTFDSAADLVAYLEQEAGESPRSTQRGADDGHEHDR
jgi:hypothetical protein